MIDLNLNSIHAFKRFLREVSLSNIFKDKIMRFTFLNRICTFSDLT